MKDEIGNKTKKNKSLVNQLLDFGVGPIIGMGISMLTVPITTRILTPEEYGKSSLFTLFQSIFLIIGLMGLDQGFVRFYNDKEIDKTKLMQNSLFYPLLLSGVLILISIFFYKPISIFLFGSVEFGLMIAFCFYIPALLINRFLLLQIRMDLKGKIYSFLSIFTQVITFITLICFLHFYQKTFRSIVYATIIGMVISTFVCLIFSNKNFILTKYVYSKKLQKQLFKFSLPLVPSFILSWLLNSFDKVGLRTWSDFNQLGLYSAAFKIVALLNVFQNIFTTTWVPIAYKWYEEDVPNEKFEDVSTVVLAIFVILFSLIIVFRNIIMLFLGEQYRNTASIFVFLLFVPVMYTVSETTCYGINFAKKTVYSLYIAIIASFLNLLGNFLLIPKYGAEGAAITTCISYIAFFWGRTLFSRKLWFKFGLKKYFFNILLLILFGINILLWQSKILEIFIFITVLMFNIILLYSVLKKNVKRGSV